MSGIEVGGVEVEGVHLVGVKGVAIGGLKDAGNVGIGGGASKKEYYIDRQYERL